LHFSKLGNTFQWSCLRRNHNYWLQGLFKKEEHVDY
jgi:hypothetical protein